MKSSLAFTANKRVSAYQKSVSSVHENVLLFKGFLGPSLKDKPELSSVGARAARAAGVIVDSAGKLRCPPGTPNANQFTDMQMSNCMVPGLAVAKRAARATRREVGELLTNAKKVLDKKEVGTVARVAALASLATLDALDYMQVDGSGTLSAMTLLGVDLLRSAGRDVAEMALNRLERNGKLTKEQRSDIQKVIDKVHDVGTSKYAGAAMAVLRRKNRQRKRRLETPQMDQADAAAPDMSNRAEDLMKVTFDTDSFHTELNAKVSKLLDTYVPDSKHKNFEAFGDELMGKMGLPPTSRNAKKMLDDGMDDLQQSLPRTIARLRDREDALDDGHFALRTQMADRMQKVSDLMQTEDGRAAVREEMGRGLIETLAGVEMMMRDNESLRGRFTFEVHAAGDNSPGDCAGYAFYGVYDDGKIIPAQRIMAESLIMDKSGLSNGVMQQGDMFDGVARIAGADDFQLTIGIHETAHTMHYMQNLRRMGIDPSADAKPVLEQIKSQGASVGATYAGARFAMRHGIDPDTTWDELQTMWKDTPTAISIFGYGAKLDKDKGKQLEYKFADFVSKIAHEDTNDGSILDQMSSISALSYEKSDKADLFSRSIYSLRSGKNTIYGFGEDERLKDLDSIRGMVETALDGQTVEEFFEEGKKVLSDTLGVDMNRLATAGLSDEQVMQNLGQASLYGKTNIWEAVAEAKTVEMLTKSFPDTKVLDDVKFDDMKRDIDVIIPSEQSPFKSAIMTPEAIAWVKKLQDAVERMPEISQNRSIDF